MYHSWLPQMTAIWIGLAAAPGSRCWDSVWQLDSSCGDGEPRQLMRLAYPLV
jgi:hypothetical protein